MIGLIVAAFIAGEAAAWIAAVIITGAMDKITEWRKRRNEQKAVQRFHQHHGGGAGGADLSEREGRQQKDMGRLL